MASNSEKNKLSRRHFLIGSSGVALSIPFLPSLHETQAAVVSEPKYLFCVRSRHGAYPDDWFPSNAQNWTSAGPSIKKLDLSSYSGDVTAIFGANFNKYRSRTLQFRHLDPLITTQDHGSTIFLTASQVKNAQNIDLSPNQESIDNLIANEISTTAAKVKVTNILPPGSNIIALENRFSHIRSGGQVMRADPTAVSPAALFDLFFKSFVGTDAQKAQAFSRRMLLVDHVCEQYKKVSATLSAEHRPLLERHMEGCYEVENKLQAQKGRTCTSPLRPAEIFKGTETEKNKLYIDIIVSAMGCDLTRVANLAMLNHDLTLPKDFHTLHHTGASERANLLKIEQWFANIVAYLLDRMDQTIVAANGKSLLANGLVYYAKELTQLTTHLHYSQQNILFGNVNGKLSTGYAYDYSSGVTNPKTALGGEVHYFGRPYNELLITILKAFGLTTEKWEMNGQPGIGTYILSPEAAGKYNFGDKRSALPFVLV